MSDELMTVGGKQQEVADLLAQVKSDPAFKQEALPPGEVPFSSLPLCKIDGISTARASYYIAESEWDVPKINGLTVLHVAFERRFYKDAYSGDKVAPTCQSPDGRVGYATGANRRTFGLSTSCADCSRNRRGSGYVNDPTMQDCTSRASVYAYVPDYVGIPHGEDKEPSDGIIKFDFATTSMMSMQDYIQQVQSHGMETYQVVCNFGLEQYKSGRGKVWRVSPSIVSPITDPGELHAMLMRLTALRSEITARPNIEAIEAEADPNAMFVSDAQPAIAASSSRYAQPARPKPVQEAVAAEVVEAPVVESDDDELGFD